MIFLLSLGCKMVIFPKPRNAPGKIEIIPEAFWFGLKWWTTVRYGIT